MSCGRTFMRVMIMIEFAELSQTQDVVRSIWFVATARAARLWSKKSMHRWNCINDKYLKLLLLVVWFLHSLFLFSTISWRHNIYSRAVKLAGFGAENRKAIVDVVVFIRRQISTKCKISLISNNNNYRSVIKNACFVFIYIYFYFSVGIEFCIVQ